jgi:hypothetical protein
VSVADLIEELKKYPPYIPVKVLTSHVITGPESGGEAVEIDLGPEDALEADVVIFEGSHVLIESK